MSEELNLKQELTPTEEQSVIDKAELLAKRIEDGNQRSEEILKRQEELLSRQMLSGRSAAGSSAPVKKEETPREYAKRIMEGRI